MTVERRGCSLKVERLSKAYGSSRVLDDVSFSVDAGQFFTLLGPSGSGKTTILKVVAGFVPQDTGDVYAGERELSLEPPHRRDVGLVFQNYALFPHMTVAANVGFPLRMRRVPRAEAERRIREALEIVQLTGFEHRHPRQLSGGQQQRVALARTLVFNPSVVLMDEPLGALDRKLREHMQTEIKQIQRRLGVTVVYVTHDQEEALTLSDRIGVMHRGRLEQVGTPQDLYDRPHSRFVADFIGESNFLPGRVLGGDASGVAFESRRGAKLRAAPGPVAAAGPAVLFVRPEKIALAGAGEIEGRPEPPTSSEGGNAVAGTVREAIFVGESCRYQVELDSGDRLTVKQMNTLARSAHAPGDRVAVAFRPHDARVFPEEPEGGSA